MAEQKIKHVRDFDGGGPLSRLTIRCEYADGGVNELSTPNPTGTMRNAASILMSLMLCPQRYPEPANDR